MHDITDTNIGNRPMYDIYPLDVTIAYMSEINTPKTIKCLGYLWLEDIFLMERLKEVQHFGVIDHDIQITVAPVLYIIRFATPDEGEDQQ